MDVEAEFTRSLRHIELKIQGSAYFAVRRIEEMFTVGLGYCHCGLDVDSHDPYSDNHAPVEVRIDKGRIELGEYIMNDSEKINAIRRRLIEWTEMSSESAEIELKRALTTITEIVFIVGPEAR